MKKLGLMMSVAMIMLLFSACSKPTGKSSGATSDSTSTSAEKEDASKSNWEYSEDANKMSDKKTYYAKSIDSEDLNFQFPYNQGENHASILLRNQEGKTDVLLMIDQGQFLSEDVYGGSVRVKFDNEKPEDYSYSKPSDYSTTSIFINETKKFIKHLKSSKKAIIEATFYQEGNKQMEFNIGDLKWSH